MNFESFSNVISNQVFDNKNWRTFQLIARTWKLIARNCFNFKIQIFRFSKILTFFTLWINYKLVSRYQEWSKTVNLEDWLIKYTIIYSLRSFQSIGDKSIWSWQKVNDHWRKNDHSRKAYDHSLNIYDLLDIYLLIFMQKT